VALERAGAVLVYVARARERDRAQFGEIDGLILPGTTVLKLLHIDGLLRVAARVWGSEAGVRDVRGGDSDGAGCEQSLGNRNALSRDTGW